LYRKYRPAAFAEVVGQEHVTDPLRTALAAGRINHAYLFSGPRGCGKTSSARIMARSLNCAQGPTPDPCGECDSCKALAPEGTGSIDVTELDAASHGGVDDARELRDRAFYAPAESRYRVFIIDEAHMVTTQGFNALLKIVEEPPEHLIFIFATTEPEKVLPTIRSRTHHYPFRLIPPSAMRELLERNVASEGVKVDPAVYPLVIRAGGGSARDTQSVLDQLLAGAGPDGIDYSRAVALLGVTDVALIDDMVDGLIAEDSAAVYGTVESLTEAGHDPRRFATDLLDRLRDLILLRAVPDAATKGLLSAPDEELSRMRSQAEKIGAATLSRYAEIVHNGLLEMRGATAPRLLLELLCARMMLPAASEGEAAVLQRLERMERRIAAGTVSGPAEPSAPSKAVSAPVAPPERSYQRPSLQQEPTPSMPSAPQSSMDSLPPSSETAEPSAGPVAAQSPSQPSEHEVAGEPEPGSTSMPADSPAIGVIDAVAVRRAWPQLLDTLRKTPGNRSTGAMLAQASVHSVEGATVVLAHPAAPLAKRLAEAHNTEKIAAVFHEVLGGEWQVSCVQAGAAPAVAQPTVVKEAPARSFQRSSIGERGAGTAARTGTPPAEAPPAPSELVDGEPASGYPVDGDPASGSSVSDSGTPVDNGDSSSLSSPVSGGPSHSSVAEISAQQSEKVPTSSSFYEEPEEDFYPDADAQDADAQDSGGQDSAAQDSAAQNGENPNESQDPAAAAHKLLEEHLGARLID
jgi:DNA polymerase-3 subunit gamma/tau